MKHTIKTDADLSEALTIIKDLIGLPCWDPRLGYAERLELHLGEKIPAHPKLKRQFDGAWLLTNNSNYWELYSNGELIPTGNKTLNEVKEDLKIVAGTTITDVDISFPDLILRIEFSNGSGLKLFPEDDEYNLSYWELFTPGNMVLEFGPHRMWSYGRSDVPLSYNE